MARPQFSPIGPGTYPEDGYNLFWEFSFLYSRDKWRSVGLGTRDLPAGDYYIIFFESQGNPPLKTAALTYGSNYIGPSYSLSGPTDSFEIAASDSWVEDPIQRSFAIRLYGEPISIPETPPIEDLIVINEPGYMLEIINDNLSSQLSRCNEFAFDGNGNIYALAGEDKVIKIDNGGNESIFITGIAIQGVVSTVLEGIDIDNSGNMYLLAYINYELQPDRYILVKISKFSCIQDQIDNMELLPGPPGPEGPSWLTPAEIEAMQQTITENRLLLKQLPQLKKDLEALQ